MNRWTITALIAFGAIAPTACATNQDLEAEQATADLVAERGAEHAQLQADVLFAEVSR